MHEYIRGADTTSLAKRLKQIDDEIGLKVAQLAAICAWSLCFARLENDDRQHMEAWQQSMERVGKGKGKHAWRHRREAQQHLNKCLDAVPAWIMPLHRVWDTVDPLPGMFDVIIVDEASQCGVEALPLFYLGKKILVVGDDKQISPDAVGTPRDAVYRLMEELLFDFDFKSAFDIESSLFDHGKRQFGVHRITLREHFRCMLFHSVTREDLGSSCLRRRLLDFFEDTEPQAIAGISREDLEHRAASDNRQIIKPPNPFESWFEVDVALELLRRKYTVIPQVKVAGKRIDLVVQGAQTALAVECDGDAWHGADRYEADMDRQRILERCGWQFYRIRESHFYADPVDAMQGLSEALADRGICPPGREVVGSNGRQDGKEQHAESNSSRGYVDEASQGKDDASTVATAPRPSSERSRRRAKDVPASEIQEAIVQALSKCPNCSCTEGSLTTRVLRELGIRSAGQPRKDFGTRVRLNVNALEKRGVVEKYRAKNQRVRLRDRSGK